MGQWIDAAVDSLPGFKNFRLFKMASILRKLLHKTNVLSLSQLYLHASLYHYILQEIYIF